MNEEKINNAILTLDTLIDCCKEDGTYYNAQKEWEALEVFKQLQQENAQLKRQIKIKDKWCQLLIDIGFDYDGFNQVDSLKGLIDELVRYAKNSISNDDTTPIYVGAINKTNILGEVVEGNNE